MHTHTWPTNITDIGQNLIGTFTWYMLQHAFRLWRRFYCESTTEILIQLQPATRDNNQKSIVCTYYVQFVTVTDK